ncbi:MbcA/ParS/Xre antitoxin family protein [Amphibiibacter pelophylacis]|uniref:MbcA/ParS/Xre antitoxin family protein n=1 Tax=Amphibiibacter pelophylacis TaxID=1799477 RepID=A0ACC6NZD3_9BURK
MSQTPNQPVSDATDFASAAPPEDEAHDRSRLAVMVMTLLDHWQISTEAQANLLGLAPGNRAALARYRRGEPIGSGRDQQDRVGHLLAIHKNLRLLFPHDRALAYGWMSRPNRAFDQRTPVDLICDLGFAGLLAVRGYLDRARGR